MNVYFVGGRYESCYYVRCFVPMVAAGWDGFRTSLREDKRPDDQILKGILAADVIVFQRPMYEKHLKLLELCQKAGKKVVFDNDDTYKPDTGTPTAMTGGERQRLEGFYENLNQFMRRADLVTTTTEFLAEEYRQVNGKVVVLPNMIEPEDWPEPERNEGERVRVGIFGSAGSNGDYLPIKHLLDELNGKVDLVIMSHPSKDETRQHYQSDINFWEQYEVEEHPLVRINHFPEMLNSLKLDLTLIPRDDSYFNRAKSNLKFLEASMLEIPVVAQGFTDGKSPYQDPEDQKYMRIATNLEEWFDHTFELVENKQLRRDMGQAARKYVLENYDINQNIDKWETAYQSLCE